MIKPNDSRTMPNSTNADSDKFIQINFPSQQQQKKKVR